MEDSGEAPGDPQALADGQPVRPVLADVVAGERPHREGVAAQFAEDALGGRGAFGCHRCTEVHAVRPRARFGDEGHGVRAASSEHNRVDDDSARVGPFARRSRALVHRHGEAGVGVRGGDSAGRSPLGSGPVDEVVGLVFGEPLPPHIAVVGQRDVGEHGVPPECLDRDGVGRVAGAGSNPEQSRFGVERAQQPVVINPHPDDVVAQGLDLPPRQCRLHHREVSLSTRAGERGRDVSDLPLW